MWVIYFLHVQQFLFVDYRFMLL